MTNTRTPAKIQAEINELVAEYHEAVKAGLRDLSVPHLLQIANSNQARWSGGQSSVNNLCESITREWALNNARKQADDELFRKQDEVDRRQVLEEAAAAVSEQGFYRDESGEKAAEIIRDLISQ